MECIRDILLLHLCRVSCSLPTPGLPPEAPLPTPTPSAPQLAVSDVPDPVFHMCLIDDEENHADIDRSDS